MAIATLLVLWVTSQVGLARLIDASLWLRDPLYADKCHRLRNRFTERTTAAGKPVSVVVVGSSRTCFAVRGDVIEAALELHDGRRAVAFNFGIPAAGPVTNLLTVRRLLSTGHRPTLVVIEVLPPLFADGGTGSAEQPFLLPNRLQAPELEGVLRFGFPAAILDEWRSAQTVPCYGLRFALLGRVAAKWLPTPLRFSCGRDSDATGWLKPIKEAVDASAYRAGVDHARRQYHELLQRLRFDTPAFAALDQTVAECRRCGVRAALLLMPEGSEFRSWYPPRVEVELSTRLADMSHRTGTAFIDARRWLADEAFSDAHHVLPVGATQFSERLAYALRPLLLDDIGGR